MDGLALTFLSDLIFFYSCLIFFHSVVSEPQPHGFLSVSPKCFYLRAFAYALLFFYLRFVFILPLR